MAMLNNQMVAIMLIFGVHLRFSNKGWPDKSSRSRRFAEFPGMEILQTSETQNPSVCPCPFSCFCNGQCWLLSTFVMALERTPGWRSLQASGRGAENRDAVHVRWENWFTNYDNYVETGHLIQDGWNRSERTCWSSLPKHCSAMQSAATACKGLVPIQKIKTLLAKLQGGAP
jgi:hypothetical protein